VILATLKTPPGALKTWAVALKTWVVGVENVGSGVENVVKQLSQTPSTLYTHNPILQRNRKSNKGTRNFDYH